MNFLVQQQPAYVDTAGKPFDPARPTVVFIHGAANDHRVWLNTTDALARFGINCLAVDLPGHGKSFANAKPRIEDYADWMINLLDNGAIKKAILVGHSMGSLIAIDCARRFPERVDKIVLIGAAAPMPVAEKVLLMAREQPDAAFDMLVRASFYVQRCADGSWPPATSAMQTYRNILVQSRPHVLANDMAACAQYAIDPAALKQIITPALVLVGQEDRMTSPDAGMAVAAMMANAKLLIIPAAGHMMMAEAPDAVHSAIADVIHDAT